MFLWGCACTPGLAATPSDSWAVALRHAMQRSAEVEWRLQKAAGTSCPAMAAATGLVLDSLDSYAEADRPMSASVLGMSGLPQVAAVAATSPAAQAGISPGDELLAVEGTDLPGGPDATGATLALRTTAALANLPAGKPVRMKLRRAGAVVTVQFVPARQCASHIFVDTENRLRAYSDGANIKITARMVDFTLSDDELAILAGHELGHIIARDGEAADIGERRRKEDRADALGADLAACAAYDTKAAAPFWRRLEKTEPLRWLAIRMQSAGKVRTRNVRERPAPATCPVTGAPPLNT